MAENAFLKALSYDLQGQGMMAMDMLEEAAWADPDDRWLQFALATKLREFRRSPEALALVRRALHLPGEETADQWSLAAGLWLEAGNRDSAEVCWTRVLEFDPESREARLGLASLAEARGDHATMARHFSAMADAYGQSGRALASRAVGLWVRAGMLDSACALLERRWKTWESPEDGEGLARLLATRGLTDSAVALYDHLSTLPDQEALELRLRAARAFMLSGRADSARVRLRELSMQGFVEARLTLAALLLDMDSLPQARELLLSHVDSPEHEALASHYLGLVAARRNQTDSARTWFERSLSRDPKRPDTWTRRGLIELDAGKPDSAARIFSRMVRLWPTSAQARWLQGHALARAADARTLRPAWKPAAPDSEPMAAPLRRRALDAFDTALALDPDHPRARFERAATLERLGLRAQASAALDTIVAHDSDHAVAANYLAYMLAEDSLDLGKAEHLANRALALDSSNASYLDTRAWVRYRLGRFQEALNDLDRAIALGEDDVVVLEHRARVLEALNRPELARKAWRQVLDKAPDHPDARRAVGSIP
jgi:tetratricopeptide (TPR) repeat protein